MGPLGGTGDSGPCSVNFVCLGNKEFYVDEPEVVEFEGQKGGVEKKEESEVGELGANETDVNLQCGDAEVKRQIQDEILQEQLEKLWKTDFADSVVSSSASFN